MIKPIAGLLVATTWLLLIPRAAAQDCPSPTGRHVRVSGSAVVRLPPDRVSFSVGVETLHANVSLAFRTNAQKVEAVLDALRAKGVQPRELQTSDLEVSSRLSDGTKVNGYRVSNRVSVTREAATGVGDLIQAAISAGANEANRLKFFVANPGAAQARGLELAYASGRAKAETLASLARQSLGDALCVSESWARDNTMENVMRNAPAEGGGSVEPGTEAITFAVDIVFTLK